MASLADILAALPSLRSSDILVLKAELEKYTLQTDIVASLPAELQIQVFASLDTGDLWVCLQVSRLWRYALLSASKDISPALFPGLKERVALEGNVATAAATTPDRDAFHLPTTDALHQRLADAFLDECRSRYVVSRGLFSSAAVVRPFISGDGSMPLAEPREMQRFQSSLWTWLFEDTGQSYSRHPRELLDSSSVLYAAGRVAWRRELGPEKSPIFVDDLRTRRRHVFYLQPHDGHTTSLKALGDKLVVVASSSSVIAWNLVGNGGQVRDRIRSSRPLAGTTFVTSGDYVVWHADFYVSVWKFHGIVVGIDITPSLRRVADFNDFHPTDARPIIHPFLKDVYYCTFAYRRSEPTSVSVFEFTDGQCTGSWVEGVPGNNDRNYGWASIPGRQVDANGSFIVAVVLEEVPVEDPTYARVTCVEFNVLTKKFRTSLREYRLPLPPSGCFAPLVNFWNDGASVFTTPKAIRRAELNSRGLLLGITSHPSGRRPFVPADATLTDRMPNQTNPVSPNDGDARFSVPVQFGLEGFLRAWETAESTTVGWNLVPIPGMPKLCGDNDFLVLIAGQGYTYWRYKKLAPCERAAHYVPESHTAEAGGQ